MDNDQQKILKMVIEMVAGKKCSEEEALMYNYNDIELAFNELAEDFKDDSSFLKKINACYQYVQGLYDAMSFNVILSFSYAVFGHSIDYVLLSYSQEEISLKLELYLQQNDYPLEFKSVINEHIQSLSQKLNKRFCFDDVALIHLIEASSGTNIISSEGNSRKNDGKVVVENNGSYYFKNSPSKQVYTHGGGKILSPLGKEREEQGNIRISSFPLGNQFKNTDGAMKKVMEILFENLNLCIETYQSIYNSSTNIVQNYATLADGSFFRFGYIINENNIPHLLGFPRGNTLSSKAIEYLNILVKSNGRPKRKDGTLITLSEHSGALDVLKVIYENQKHIIELWGLYEENGKKYEIINWEKVILKTTAFMRGDFFKTCFCLVKLSPDKYLVDPKAKGGYVSISSTEYNNNLNTTKTTRSVLNDLLKTRKQKRDFIFRGFLNTSKGQIVNTLVTGKAETLHVGKSNELLKTLQKYRDLFLTSPDDGGEKFVQSGVEESGGPNTIERANIVTEIENDRLIKKFTPQEQADLHISLISNLSLSPFISNKEFEFLKSLSSMYENYENDLKTDENSNPYHKSK